MIKNPYWIPYCVLVAGGAVSSGMSCAQGGNPLWATYALLSLMDCLCFGYGLAKARGLSLWR